MEELTRVWRPDWPCPVAAIVGVHRRGPGDPTFRRERDGSIWRGIRTPEGVGTLHLTASDSAVTAQAWGPGAAWLLEYVPRLLGADDDWEGWEAHHPLVAQAQRSHPHWRLGASGCVMDALVPAIIEQKVTGQEAYRGFRGLIRRFGERAPGPHPDLWVQPAPERIAGIASWEWLSFPIDPARSRTLVAVARRASSIERVAHGTPQEFDAAIRSLPGIGEWTAAEVRQRALGDPDAVSFGDYHVAKDLTWALTGRVGDDEDLRVLLAPYAGHRGRVQALLALAGHHRPRRGPRMAPRTHLPARS